MLQNRVSFVGAGRVAGALCREMHMAGLSIHQIVSETGASSRKLADSCKASWSQDLTFTDATDIIIVAVPDHRLKTVLENIKCSMNSVIVHTAGSMGIDIFPEHMKHVGVLYPLQTFSNERKVVFKNLPFFIEASDNHSLILLKNIAEAIGGKVHFVDTEHRRLLHVASVFVCNFTNHMFSAGKEISSKAGFSFDVLEPLIKETVSKALERGPENSQTGPAVRSDHNTIKKHLNLLSFSPDLQSIYREVTKSIIHYHKSSER